MKTNIRTVAIAAVATIASLCPALHAQTGWTTARVNVPFSFDYGMRHFERGSYTLSVSGSRVLTVRGSGGVASAMMQPSYNPTGSDPTVIKVEFRKYGDRYFLTEVLSAYNEIDVLESQAERRAARGLAMHGAQPETVALLLVPQRIFGR